MSTGNSRRVVLARSAEKDDRGAVFEEMVRQSDAVKETVSAFQELEDSAQSEFLSSLISDISSLSTEIDAGRAALDESRRAGYSPRAEDVQTVIEKERRLALLEVSSAAGPAR